MNQTDTFQLENIQQEIAEWFGHDIHKTDKVGMLTLLAKALPLIKPSTPMQHDIIENILGLAPEAGRVSPVKTIEALSKSILWASNHYIPYFARLILLLENPAIDENANTALCALEQSLVVCYCAILPKNVHGAGRANDICIEWQRHTFFSVINAIEAKAVDPEISSSILRMSETMTAMSHQLSDIHERIQFVAQDQKPEHLSWH